MFIPVWPGTVKTDPINRLIQLSVIQLSRNEDQNFLKNAATILNLLQYVHHRISFTKHWEKYDILQNGLAFFFQA